MKITTEEIQHVAKLARLEMAGDDLESFAGQVGDILSYVDKLGEVATEDVEPMAHAISVTNAFRKEGAETACTRDEIMANAPAAEEGMFEVPKIIE
ncbi:MAG: Asp-tRNA(Asn)/Glu-tRNA(Gln) amidotransferase subunit GatC [Thermodesulfobacteriota bacterium]|nr:Asp-tRNA(Asn)/Glu-tRNA(Gln) amidotransferase subunit GatC [Thermodesulfobacteriota bacterium]